MSVGPMGSVAGSVAGSTLAQTQGSETERARQDAGSQQRQIQTDEKAEAAAGIGATDGEDHEAADRDADGRRLWEHDAEEEGTKQPDEEPEAQPPRQSKDATGQSGNLLDLSG